MKYFIILGKLNQKVRSIYKQNYCRTFLKAIKIVTKF